MTALPKTPCYSVLETPVWLRTALDFQQAPFPEISGTLEHSNDLIYAPPLAVLGAKTPEEAMKHFRGFVDERLVRKVITPDRVSTSWVGRDVIVGAESTNFTRDAVPSSIPRLCIGKRRGETWDGSGSSRARG